LASSRNCRVDVRLIAAANRGLAGMVERSEFRKDLYHRLNVFPILMPPLRQRSEDIRMLVHHFVQHCARRMNKTIETIPSDTMQALNGHS
jgi:formate hydrogenlyase transcriptional activator